MYSTFDVLAGDGTRLTAWRTGAAEGPRVLVCNGMGVPPEAWPRLLAEGCQYQVAGWYQRGVLGSDRPADPDRIQIEDHTADALTLMDELGWDSAVVVAWSLGVNVAFELAREHPRRVRGLLSVAGVPGGTFDTILAPQLVPRPLRRPLGLGLVRAGRVVSAPLNQLGRVLPSHRTFAEVVRLSGVMLPTADMKDVQPWVAAFFSQDWGWYFRLAEALERHGAIDPSFIDVPVTIVAGLLDALTSHDDVRAYARRIPDAEVHSLPGTHCLPLEYADRLMELLDLLLLRVELHEAGQAMLGRFTGALDATPTPAGLPAPAEPPAAALAPVAILTADPEPSPVPAPRVPRDLPWWASTEPASTPEPAAPRRPSPRLAV